MKKHVKSHDAFFRKCISRKQVARELFETYLPAELLAKLNLDKLKKQNSSFLSNILGEGIVDVLYRVEIAGEESYVSVICEHQSTPDPMMTFRLQKYILRICDEHQRKHPKSKLPLVYPLIIYTGQKKYTAAKSFYELFSDQKLAKEYLTQAVTVVDVNEIEDDALREKYHMGFMLFLMHHIHEKNIVDHLQVFKEIVALISKEDFNYLEDVLYYVLEQAHIQKNLRESFF